MIGSSRPGLLLLGHGSHFNADSSAAIHSHADRIRSSGAFAEVRVGFWKEEPAICRALELFHANRVLAVPVFMSGGYFTEEVVPRELGIPGPGRHENHGKTIWYTQPVGTHRSLADVIVQRALQAGASGAEALVVLGHGTSRHSNSEKNIYRQADRVREIGGFAEVTTAFLDQKPGLDEIWTLVKADEIIVVPLFVADGWHVAETIPRDLDLAGGENRREGRGLRFAGAVGTHEKLSRVIHLLALEACPDLPAAGDPSPGDSREERELERILSVGRCALGELKLSRFGNGVVIEGPGSEPRQSAPSDRMAFRRWIRHTEEGIYRPLSGARSLRPGWRVQCGSMGEAAERIEMIYPGAILHSTHRRAGSLRITPPHEALSRQSGRYEPAGTLCRDRIDRCAVALCSTCVRSPVWLKTSGTGGIPCPEPCSVFVALAREVAGWGETDKGIQTAGPADRFAAFENPSNPIRQRYFSG